MTIIDTFSSDGFYLRKPSSKTLQCKRRFQSKAPFLQRPFGVVCKLTKSHPGDTSKDGFMTRTLKENPSQIETRYLIGGKFYTLKEKEELNKNQMVGFVEFLKRLNLDSKPKKERNESQNEGGKDVYLKEILREYKGNLYVPEQVFGAELSEEEEFDRNLEVLPKMSFEDFKKAMKSDKVKLLNSKEIKGITLANGYRDFVVDLKEIPGEKGLHKIKWALRLDEYEAQELEEYRGPHYEIETRTTADLWQGINFSRSKAEARVDGSTGVKFSYVAGIDEAVEELQELVRYLKNPELFDKMGIKPRVLLEGPPGCGKTMAAKAIAGEAGVPFYEMAGPEFVKVLAGVGSARIRDLFKRAKVNKPSVIFILYNPRIELIPKAEGAQGFF